MGTRYRNRLEPTYSKEIASMSAQPRSRWLRLFLFACTALVMQHAQGQAQPQSAQLPRWQTLPPTPVPVAGEQTGRAEINGIRLYYATIGRGSPVILLHGGLSNSDYLGNQVRALMKHHKVVIVDSRGHGRSTRDARAFGYDLMADDVVGLMDMLGVHKADIVGWSDGGIVGLDLALRHKDRVGKIFAFAANSLTSGVRDGVEKNPTFAAYIERAGHEYEAHSTTPKA